MPRVHRLRGKQVVSVSCAGILSVMDRAFIPLGRIAGDSGNHRSLRKS